jgi:hypothetical protein
MWRWQDKTHRFLHESTNLKSPRIIIFSIYSYFSTAEGGREELALPSSPHTEFLVVCGGNYRGTQLAEAAQM